MVKVPFYFQSVDFQRMVQDYPPAPDFFADLFKRPPADIQAIQERRLKEAIQR